MDVSVILASLSAPVAVASALTAFRALRFTRRSAALPVLVGLLAEYRRSAFKDDERWVRNDLAGRTYGELQPDEQARAARVAHFYDNVGLLVAIGAAEEKPLLAFLGDAAQQRFWELWPLIHEVRERQGEYQMYFESFVALAIASPPSRARAGIRRISEVEKQRRLSEGRRATQPRPAEAESGDPTT